MFKEARVKPVDNSRQAAINPDANENLRLIQSFTDMSELPEAFISSVHFSPSISLKNPINN